MSVQNSEYVATQHICEDLGVVLQIYSSGRQTDKHTLKIVLHTLLLIFKYEKMSVHFNTNFMKGFICILQVTLFILWGPGVAQWLRRCATSQTVPGSIPGDVTGDFFRGTPCALGSTQPLKVSTRDFFCGKGGRCVWLTTYHPCSAEMSRKSGTLTYPEPLGPPRPVARHLYFTFCYLYF